MVTLHIYDTKKNVLGFTFHLFEREQFVIDYQKHKTTSMMKYYLQDSKSDVLGINIEKFLCFCRESLSSSTILIDESISEMNDLCAWRIENKEYFIPFLEKVKSKFSLLKVIVSGLQGADRDKGIMMIKMIKDFVDIEIENELSV